MLKNGFRGVAAGLAMLLAAGAAMAQWQWVDESGKKVYSDRPPPITVPEHNILKMPRGASLSGASAAAAAAQVAQPGQTGQEQAAEQPPSQEDQDLKAKAEQIQAQQEAQKQQEKAKSDEIAQKNAEIEKSNAATRKTNCERARSRLTQLEPGKRVMTTDASGKAGFMSDETRAAERESAQAVIRANCS